MRSLEYFLELLCQLISDDVPLLNLYSGILGEPTEHVGGTAEMLLANCFYASKQQIDYVQLKANLNRSVLHKNVSLQTAIARVAHNNINETSSNNNKAANSSSSINNNASNSNSNNNNNKLFLVNDAFKNVYEPYLWLRHSKFCSDFQEQVREA